jgi:hypothetical protein
VAAAVRRDPALRERWTFYPLLPYITKYIRQSNEKGLVNLVLDQLKQAGWSQSLGMVARSGLGFLTKDYRRILTTLIDLELAPFQSLRVGTVFLHDVLTDLALALDLPELLAVHVEAVRNRFDARGGFATKNLPLLVNRLRAYGFERPAILAQVNKAGFGMNPSRSLCEQTLQRTDLEVMAMGTLASGLSSSRRGIRIRVRAAGCPVDSGERVDAGARRGNVRRGAGGRPPARVTALARAATGTKAESCAAL